MAQPTLRTNTSRSRLGGRIGGVGMPSSRSGDRIHSSSSINNNNGEGSTSSSSSFPSATASLRNKVSRTHMSSNASSAVASGKAAGIGVERRRPALGDKTNMQNVTQDPRRGADHTLKHKMPSNSGASANVTANVISKQRPQSVHSVSNASAASSTRLSVESSVSSSNSFAGGRHVRGSSSSSGATLSRNVSGTLDNPQNHQTSAATRQNSLSSRQASQQSIHRQPSVQSGISNVELRQQELVRPMQTLLDVRGPSSNTNADEEMSDVDSEWNSSTKTETDDDLISRRHMDSTAASSDGELVNEGDEEPDEEDDDDASSTHSSLIEVFDPDCLISLPAEIDELARDKAAQICARYEEEVVQPAMIRQALERQEAVSRGELAAESAAHDDELALMGLDPDEVRDTSMVAEYSAEIFEYMSKCERRTMANPNYMDFQGEIRWHMRSTLVDWLMQVHMRYHMMPETLWIAINVVDRFLSARVVSLAKLQLVGVTAMFIAAKYEEIIAPSVEEFVFMTEHGYTREEILKGERIILSTLDFNISGYCSPYSWVRKISKADDYDIQTRTLAKFLMELTLYDHRFLHAKPSQIAAIAMYLSKKMLGGTWDDAFVYYCELVEEQLVPGANLLLERLVDDSFADCFVCKKYGNRKFLKASHFARDWALRNHEQLLVASASASSNMSAMTFSGGVQHVDAPVQAPSASAPAAAVY